MRTLRVDTLLHNGSVRDRRFQETRSHLLANDFEQQGGDGVYGQLRLLEIA